MIFDMDEDFVIDYFKLKHREFSRLTQHELFNSLLVNEYRDMEELKDSIFKRRLEYFTLAKCLKEKMISETGRKQLKRYLVVEFGMHDERARKTAKQYNAACRTYDKFRNILRNVSLFPKIDVRDLNIKQLQLAVNENWLRRYNAMLPSSNKGKTGERDDVHSDVN